MDGYITIIPTLYTFTLGKEGILEIKRNTSKYLFKLWPDINPNINGYKALMQWIRRAGASITLPIAAQHGTV